jgi:hypothetical protein
MGHWENKFSITMDVVESVDNVSELTAALGLTIERMHAEWTLYFRGNEDMIPDSVIRMVDLQREMRACIEAIQFDAQGTVRPGDGGENGEGTQEDVILIDSDSDIDHGIERDHGMERDLDIELGHTRDEVVISNSNFVPSTLENERNESQNNSGYLNKNGGQDSEPYQRCPICLGDCNRQIQVSCFQPCSHFIHTTCLDQYLLSVSKHFLSFLFCKHFTTLLK